MVACAYCGRRVRRPHQWWLIVQASTGSLPKRTYCTHRCLSIEAREVGQVLTDSLRRSKLRALAERAATGDTQAALDFIKELA